MFQLVVHDNLIRTRDREREGKERKTEKETTREREGRERQTDTREKQDKKIEKKLAGNKRYTVNRFLSHPVRNDPPHFKE